MIVHGPPETQAHAETGQSIGLADAGLAGAGGEAAAPSRLSETAPACRTSPQSTEIPGTFSGPFFPVRGVETIPLRRHQHFHSSKNNLFANQITNLIRSIDNFYL